MIRCLPASPPEAAASSTINFAPISGKGRDHNSSPGPMVLRYSSEATRAPHTPPTPFLLAHALRALPASTASPRALLRAHSQSWIA